MIGVISANTPGINTPVEKRTELGKDAFLKLLVAQLRNQDPMSPLQPHEFAAQLAQFSSVEQLNKLNDAMTAQQEQVAAGQLIGQTSLASSLIGRHVVGQGSQVVIASHGATPTVPVDIGGTGGTVVVTLKDASGKTVASRELGYLGTGRHELAVPQGVAAGTYKYEVAVTGKDGKAQPVRTYISGVVDGISFDGGQLKLRLGSLAIALDDLAEITPMQESQTP